MNKLILMGRISKPIELKTTGQNTVGHFSIAVDNGNKDNGRPSADFFRITVWNKTAEVVSKYLNKGDGILVEGRINNANYDKDGVTVYQDNITADRIHFTPGKATPKADGGAAPATATANAPAATPVTDISDMPI